MFRFKEFTVKHDRSSMKVGTDSVILGAWCDVSQARTALDVGTGCGIIALMLAQRNANLQVDAIDIDHDSVTQATENFSDSPWSNRLNATEQDFITLEVGKKYDLIVSNPPFFTNGILPCGEARINARHTVTLTYHSLLSKAKTLLKSEGKIAIVAPDDCLKEILNACDDNHLFISKLTHIKTSPNKSPKRVLCEITQEPNKTTSATLIITDLDNEYTEEFRNLCRSFYLAL